MSHNDLLVQMKIGKKREAVPKEKEFFFFTGVLLSEMLLLELLHCSATII